MHPPPSPPFQHFPAQASVVPNQVEQINLLAAHLLPEHFPTDDAATRLLRARFQFYGNARTKCQHNLVTAWELLRDGGLTPTSATQALEGRISEAFEEFGFEPRRLVTGATPQRRCTQAELTKPLMPLHIVRVKNYRPPVALGMCTRCCVCGGGGRGLS